MRFSRQTREDYQTLLRARRTPALATAALAAMLAAPGTALAQDCAFNAVGTGIFAERSDGTLTTGPVVPGQELRYGVTLFAPPNSPPNTVFCNVIGGQLSVTFPDCSNIIDCMSNPAIPVAGFPALPDVPEFGPPNDPGGPGAFFSETRETYIASEDDISDSGFLIASVDYGATTLRPEQINGTFLSDPIQPTANATASIALAILIPDITLVKTADVDAVCLGTPTPVTYTFIVTNNDTGVPMTNVTIVDDQCGPVDFIDGDDGDGLLEDGEAWRFECSTVVDGAIVNEATVTGFAVTVDGGNEIIDIAYQKTDTHEIIEGQTPECVISGPEVVCPGTTDLIYTAEELTGAAGVSYQWFIDGDGSFCPGQLTTDINGDGVIDAIDLAAVFEHWGPCPGCAADVDGDGIVGPIDLSSVLIAWEEGFAGSGDTMCVNAADVCNGSFTLTVIVTDEAGCDSQCTLTVAVRDDTPPMIECPPGTIGQCDDIPPPDPSSVTATDDCGNVNVIWVGDETSGNGCPLTVTRTYRATDDCGNSSECMQTIMVNDTTPPMITCPAPISVQCPGDVPSPDPGSVTATDNCGDATVEFVSDVPDGASCPITITRTYRATDDCGNTADCTQTITVNDTLPPSIVCPFNMSVQCIGDVPDPDPSLVSASDNCGNVVVEWDGDVQDGNTCPLIITRTYRATDDCGNTATCSHLITVLDTTDPEITCPATVNVQCLADVPDPDPSSVTVSDNCSDPADIAVEHLGDETSGDSCPIVITRMYRATDECGNSRTCTQFINVDDTTPPTITCPPNETVECIADVPAPNVDDVTADDNCGNVTVDHVGDVADGITCPITITRTYRATDDCGNSTNCTQMITVNDTTDPMITCPAAVDVQCLGDVPDPDPSSVTVSDNCSDPADITVEHVGDVADGNTCPITITRTYRATDDCGNTADCTQTITVNDTTEPTIVCPANVSVQCLSDVPDPNVDDVTADDNCGNVTVEHIDDVADGNACPITITRTYRATDDCGNSADCTQMIMVNDTTDPMISCPGALSIECLSDVPAPDPSSVTASDNCGNVEVMHVGDEQSGDTCPITITRTYRATDDCGNTADCTQTITVNDTTPPVIACPADADFECEIGDAGEATATDNCGGTVTIGSSDQSSGDACTQIITRTWTATDECGNSDSCVQIITVTDNTPPTIVCPPDATFECDEDDMDAGEATATDNCPGNIDISSSDATSGDACEMIITRTWTATDACGNSSSCDQIITVVDSTPPTLMVPDDVEFICELGDAGEATADDNCDPSPMVSFEDEVVAEGPCPEDQVIERTWTAKDACGNEVSDVQIITVIGSGNDLIVLDFETDGNGNPLVNGQEVGPNDLGDFVTLTTSGDNLGAAVFDSTPGGPNDPSEDLDLLVDLGNLLILQDGNEPQQSVPGVFDDPDDDASGGMHMFNFLTLVEAESIDLVDLCDPGQSAAVTLTDIAGNERMYDVPGGWTTDIANDGPPGFLTLDLTTLADQPGENATATASEDAGFDPLSVIRIKVWLESSSAIDNLALRTGCICDPPDMQGACCLPDGTCLELTRLECLAEGGDYNGDFTTCEDVITYVWDRNTSNDSQNSDAGKLVRVHATYNPLTKNFSWAATFEEANGRLPDGFTLVLNDGPNPSGTPGELAILYFDASGTGPTNDPILTVFAYNGTGTHPNDSYRDGDGEGDNDPNPDPIVSSLNPLPMWVHDLSVTNNADGTRTLSFDINACDINEHEPMFPGAGPWKGLEFDNHIGTWFHPLVIDDAKYNDGFLKELKVDEKGWYDRTDDETQKFQCLSDNGACCLLDGTCMQLSEEECNAFGGLFHGDGSSCEEVVCDSDCCENGKPRLLVIRYTGEDCSATDNDQGNSDVCEGDPDFMNVVRIRASDKSDEEDDGARVWFDGLVNLGDAFNVLASNAGETKLTSNTHIHIIDPADDRVLQYVKIHTSCSVPLMIGDQFGANLIIGCEGEDEPVEGDCCEFGKPRILVMEYTGDDCSATVHGQDDGKVVCDGDPNDMPVVRILSTDKEDPEAGDARVWFEGLVNLGDQYAIDAGNAGETRLENATFIHIFDTNDNLLQSVEFHTSCSQALFVGNQFGANLLVGCVGEDEPIEGMYCPDGPKPAALVLEYTGEDCSATNHAQDPGKVSCEGDPAFTPLVIIRVNDSENPNSGNVWFDGAVVLGDEFTIEASNADETRLSTATFVHIYDVSLNLLQSIEFHTSCSQPLRQDDQFGSIILRDYIPE